VPVFAISVTDDTIQVKMKLKALVRLLLSSQQNIKPLAVECALHSLNSARGKWWGSLPKSCDSKKGAGGERGNPLPGGEMRGARSGTISAGHPPLSLISQPRAPPKLTDKIFGGGTVYYDLIIATSRSSLFIVGPLRHFSVFPCQLTHPRFSSYP
jgi:hypothetical protein